MTGTIHLRVTRAEMPGQKRETEGAVRGGGAASASMAAPFAGGTVGSRPLG